MPNFPKTSPYSLDPRDITLSEAMYAMRLLGYALWLTEKEGKDVPEEFRDLTMWVQALAKYQALGGGQRGKPDRSPQRPPVPDLIPNTG